MVSRHKDDNSVACIVDKCYVLTYPEYCRYVSIAVCYLQYGNLLLTYMYTRRLDIGLDSWTHTSCQWFTNINYYYLSSRYRARNKLFRESRSVPLTPVPPGESTKPGSVPPSNTDPSLVFFCRQIYDHRMGKIIKNA